MATVQLTVIKSEADYFEAEVPVRNAGRGVQLYEVFQGRCRPWDIWLRAEEQRRANATTDEVYQWKPAATPRLPDLLELRSVYNRLPQNPQAGR